MFHLRDILNFLNQIIFTIRFDTNHVKHETKTEAVFKRWKNKGGGLMGRCLFNMRPSLLPTAKWHFFFQGQKKHKWVGREGDLITPHKMKPFRVKNDLVKQKEHWLFDDTFFFIIRPHKERFLRLELMMIMMEEWWVLVVEFRSRNLQGKKGIKGKGVHVK